MTVDTALINLINLLPVVQIPFDFTTLENITNLKIIRFSKLAQLHNTTVSDICNCLNSTDATISYNTTKNKWFIFYNDTDMSFIRSNRYRFSIAHEIGHLFLGHLNNPDTNVLSQGLTDTQYKIFETQADKFAAKLLCPFISFKLYNITSPKDIEYVYKLSSASADIMYQNYQKWLFNRNIKNIHDLKYQQIIKDKFDLCVYNKLNIKNQVYSKYNNLKILYGY
ncbi:MAG: ImmA/IrrE family metallo-endopeptidase [Peptoanaerobacter stomatis]|uniref:ImmA/IrrE family metallo-endopeptidase n=1 Tax=Peptoanaerobacter stomatis TaxID=796937 RepID=UPI003FA12314